MPPQPIRIAHARIDFDMRALAQTQRKSSIASEAGVCNEEDGVRGFPVGGGGADAAPEGECCGEGIIEDVDGDEGGFGAFFCCDCDRGISISLAREVL